MACPTNMDMKQSCICCNIKIYSLNEKEQKKTTLNYTLSHTCPKSGPEANGGPEFRIPPQIHIGPPARLTTV